MYVLREWYPESEELSQREPCPALLRKHPPGHANPQTTSKTEVLPERLTIPTRTEPHYTRQHLDREDTSDMYIEREMQLKVL